MKNQKNSWIQQIDQTTEDFHQYFGNLTSENLNWKPNPETWSIAQNIDHLIVINSTYFPALDALQAGEYKLPWMAGFGFMVNLFGKLILNSVQPNRKKKIKTFAVWEPSKSKISTNILDRFSTHQAELKLRIKESSDLIQEGAIISSPANRNVCYTLENAFEVIVTHEVRHLEQAKEVLKKLESNVGSEGKLYKDY